MYPHARILGTASHRRHIMHSTNLTPISHLDYGLGSSTITAAAVSCCAPAGSPTLLHLALTPWPLPCRAPSPPKTLGLPCESTTTAQSAAFTHWPDVAGMPALPSHPNPLSSPHSTLQHLTTITTGPSPLCCADVCAPQRCAHTPGLRDLRSGAQQAAPSLGTPKGEIPAA